MKGIFNLYLLLVMATSVTAGSWSGIWILDYAAFETELSTHLDNFSLFGVGDSELTEKEEEEFRRDPKGAMKRLILETYAGSEISIEATEVRRYRITVTGPGLEEDTTYSLFETVTPEGAVILEDEEGFVSVQHVPENDKILVGGVGPVVLRYNRKDIEQVAAGNVR